MEVISLRISLETCLEIHGFYGLSFFGDNGLTVEEIAALAREERLRNQQIRVSTIGRLRGLSLDPFRSGDYPHLTIKWEVMPSDDELERLVGLFDAPIPNPLLGG
jgi:hypothetical protein